MSYSFHSRTFSGALGLLLVAFFALSCGGNKDKNPTIGKHRALHGYAGGDIPGEFRGQVPALSDAQVLGFLPDNTVAAWFVRSPKELDAETEFSTIISEYPEFYSEILPHVTAPGGINLLRPATWSILGVDPERPAGVAMLIEEDSVGIFFATLSDKELFRKALDLVGLKTKLGPVVAASAGESTIYVFQGMDEVAFVVRGDVVMLVMPDRDRDLEKAVLAVSGTGSRPTLASSARVAKAFAGFDHGKDMAGFVAFDTIAAKFMAERGQMFHGHDDEAENERVRTLIAEAKAANRSKEEIADLEKGLLDSMRWQREARKRKEATTKLVDGIFGATGTVAFGMDLDGSATRMRAQVTPRAGSIPSQLLQPTDRILALPGRLQESPLFLLGAHVNPEAALGVFDLFLQADSTTRKRVSEEVHKEFGITLDELVASFDGEVSGALTMNAQSLASGASIYGDESEALGMHLLGHLSDSKSARALFDKVCTHKKLAGFVVEHEGNKALELPGFNKRKIRVEISGDYLQAMTVGAGATGHQWSDEERALLDVPSSLAVMVIDPLLLAFTMGRSMGARQHYYYKQQSHESKAATARAKPIRDELKTLYNKRSTLQTEAYGDGKGRTARFVGAAHSYKGGYALLARITGASKNLGRSLQSLIESISPEVQRARTGNTSELMTVEARISELEESLWKAIDSP